MDELPINLTERKQLHTYYFKELPAGHGWLLLEFGGKPKRS
ncbi:MAG: hypothetical protein ACOCXH_13045 [Cyclobacteriaceae bacterium]